MIIQEVGLAEGDGLGSAFWCCADLRKKLIIVIKGDLCAFLV